MAAMPVVRLDHVQLAMPAGGEAEAIAFYEGILGITHVPKPAHLAVRGGCWFEVGDLKVHLGVEADFRAATKAHPAFIVDDVRGVAAAVAAAGFTVNADEPLEGYDRVYVYDPFGNRIELMQPIGVVGSAAESFGRGGRVTHHDERPEEGWTNADGSRLVWRTLLSADRDGPVTMTAGITDVPTSSAIPTRHRHEQDEIYFVVSGAGVVDIDGVVEAIAAGSCVFVPGNVWHAVSNPGPEPIRLFYAFPTASFTDVVYEYEPGAAPPVWDD
jgi:mannose-6-phosphate isomerase-like protein (cupin superfamily)